MGLPDTPNQADVAKAMRKSQAWVSRMLRSQDDPRGKALRRCRLELDPHRFDKRKLIAEGLVDQDPGIEIDYDKLAMVLAPRIAEELGKRMLGMPT